MSATPDAVADKPPVPPWGWGFVVACGAIPVVTLGGALPAVIGFGGASGCMAIARDPARSVGMRVALCTAVTSVAWLALIAFLGGVALLTGG